VIRLFPGWGAERCGDELVEEFDGPLNGGGERGRIKAEGCTLRAFRVGGWRFGLLSRIPAQPGLLLILLGCSLALMECLGLDAEEPGAGRVLGLDVAGEESEGDFVGGDLGKSGGDLVGGEEHDRAGCRVEFDGIEEDEMGEWIELGGSDPAFGVGAGVDDVRDTGLDQGLGEVQAGGIIAMDGGADADPEGGMAVEGLELVVEVGHQMTSPRRLIWS
jgi:hypothetical protein